MSDVPAVANAVRVLERLAAAWPEPLPTATLIEEVGINRSTCYNILRTLERAGWAAMPGPRGRWSLGPRLLGLTGVPPGAVMTVVQDELDELSRRLGFVVFAVRAAGGGGYTVAAQAERGQGVRVTVSVGDTFPFAAPAIMQAFHAWTEPAEFARLAGRHGLPRFTPRTRTGPDAVRAQLERARALGFGTSVQEYDLAQSGVAAPVFDARGRVAMAVCSLAFSSELGEDSIGQAGELVRAAAARITARTGGRPPAGG